MALAWTSGRARRLGLCRQAGAGALVAAGPVPVGFRGRWVLSTHRLIGGVAGRRSQARGALGRGSGRWGWKVGICPRCAEGGWDYRLTHRLGPSRGFQLCHCVAADGLHLTQPRKDTDGFWYLETCLKRANALLMTA